MKLARIANRVKVSEIDQSKIGVQQMDDNGKFNNAKEDEVSSVYSAIKANKEASSSGLKMQKGEMGDKLDPDIKIYHVDKEIMEETDIPQYTSPQAFLESLSVSDNEPWGE